MLCHLMAIYLRNIFLLKNGVHFRACVAQKNTAHFFALWLRVFICVANSPLSWKSFSVKCNKIQRQNRLFKVQWLEIVVKKARTQLMRLTHTKANNDLIAFFVSLPTFTKKIERRAGKRAGNRLKCNAKMSNFFFPFFSFDQQNHKKTINFHWPFSPLRFPWRLCLQHFIHFFERF